MHYKTRAWNKMKIAGLISSVMTVMALQTAEAQPVHLTVFYEAMCKSSIHFFKTQLYPTWKNLTNKYLDLELVPNGGTWNGMLGDHMFFHCSHGPQECAAHKMQACALKYYKDTPDLLIEFIACDMASENPSVNASQCAKDIGLDFQPVAVCMNSTEGSELLAALGEKTTSAAPPRISQVPWLIFNKHFDSEALHRGITDLKTTVCDKIEERKPDTCFNS